MLLPLIPLAALLSTKGLMFLLLSAYGGAMWTFLSGAPRVHTVMVDNLDRAKMFYEQTLELSEAELPLHYYYNYEQTAGGFDAMYFPGDVAGARDRYSSATAVADNPGLWYQLTDNVQLHIVVGIPDSSNKNYSDRPRHVSFDREGLKELLKVITKKGYPHTVRSTSPLEFLAKDRLGRIYEFAEVDS
ncbi:MAG: hypothetical protein AAFY57_00380 [Cyanobacteria bacterium J06642_2]